MNTELTLLLVLTVLIFHLILFYFSKELFFFSLVALVVFQNFFCITLLQYLDSNSVKIWSITKDIILFFSFAVCLHKLRLQNGVDKVFFVLLASIAVLIIFSPSGVLEAIKSGRTYAYPPILYFIGRRIGNRITSLNTIYYFLIVVFFLLVIIGVFEKIYGENIWVLLNYHDYILAKYGLLIKDRIGFNNRGYLPFGLGVYIRPMSLFGESVGLAFFMSAILIITYSMRQNKKLLLLMILGILFIYVRGVILAILLAFLFNEMLHTNVGKLTAKKSFLAVGIIGILISATILVIRDPNFLSSHLISLLEGVAFFKDHIFGAGLGSANWISSYSKSTMVISSIDSFLATTLVELGIFTILYYYLNTIALRKYFMKKSHHPANTLIISYIIALYVVSILSASTFSFHSVILIYLFLGIFISNEKNCLLSDELSFASKHGAKNNYKV